MTTVLALLAAAAIVSIFVAANPPQASAASVTAAEAVRLRDEVKEMFYHGYNGYMDRAFPLDELRPLSCSGEDSLGGYALTLVDSLDMLAVLGDREKFGEAVNWIGKNLRFDKNNTISVFETTIRVLGGLLSAHMIASDQSTGMNLLDYNNELLLLAEDLGRRLLPAFETPTGIPYGSVNLIYGVSEEESEVTSTAGGGTLTLEFGVLSRLTGNPVFEEVSRNAVRGLWAQRSLIGLLGAHINVISGEWTHKDSGIGTSIDSFYEYLLKAYLLLGEDEYLYMFREAYKAVMRYLFNDPWYLEVNMNSAVVVWPLFNSLQAFWPGLQVLAGDIEPAVRTHKAFFSVWKKFGFTPEGFNLASMSVQPSQRSYPLRPELIESTYWLYKATRNPVYLDAGRDILTSIQYGARCPCGYCHIADVETHEKDDHMESFFLAETVKYLWLLFDLAAGGHNMVENGPYPYIFSTEGHLFPLTPEISLLEEHCSYPGSFCKGSSEVHATSQNGTCFMQKFKHSDDAYRPLKGTCQNVGLWRRLGIANHFAKQSTTANSNSTRDSPIVRSLDARTSPMNILELVEKAGLKLVKVNIHDDGSVDEQQLKTTQSDEAAVDEKESQADEADEKEFQADEADEADEKDFQADEADGKDCDAGGT